MLFKQAKTTFGQKSQVPMRQFAIRKKAVQESYSCQSMAKLHKYAQMQLYDHLDTLQSDIQRQPVRFGISLLNTADHLLGKRVKKKSSVLRPGERKLANLDNIKRKTLLRLLEDIDDVSIIKLNDIYRALEMLDAHGLYRTGSATDRTDVEGAVKEMYLELLQNRAHQLTQK